jgi:hypothetical protein
MLGRGGVVCEEGRLIRRPIDPRQRIPSVMIPSTKDEVQIDCQKAKRERRRWRRKGSGALDSVEDLEGGVLKPSNSAAFVKSASL